MQRVEDPPVKIDGTCADILKHAYSYSDDDALVAFSLDGGRLVDLSVDKEGDAESRGQLLRFGDKDEMPIIHIEFAAETGSKSGSRETLMPRTALPPC